MTLLHCFTKRVCVVVNVRVCWDTLLSPVPLKCPLTPPQVSRFPMTFDDFWVEHDAVQHFLKKGNGGLGIGPLGLARTMRDFKDVFGCEAIKFFSLEGIMAAGRRVSNVIVEEVLGLDSKQFAIAKDSNINPQDYDLTLLVGGVYLVSGTGR